MKNIITLITVILLAGASAASASGIQIPSGYRATVMTALPAELTQIKPGDRVDVLVTIHFQNAEPNTLTILQNVLVLDTVGKAGISGLVLALNPNEAQYALLAQSDKLRVNFIVRGKGDTELHPIAIATFKRLFGGFPEEKNP